MARQFQSTRPRGARLRGNLAVTQVHHVSIHAPRVGRDVSLRNFDGSRSCFNPRAPCGARHHDMSEVPPDINGVSIHAPRVGRDLMLLSATSPAVQFQSTRPVRGATFVHLGHRDLDKLFQSTRPCGARLDAADVRLISWSFNPRAPCGARRSCQRITPGMTCFNPRAPCGARHPQR